jgi:exopolysaccharide production protein ExoZ
MTIETPRQDVVSIQILRGVAATMVVFVHLDVQLQRLAYPVLGAGWLASGVDIFFVISGFIMWSAVERRPGITATSFLKNRLMRIAPLYWLITALLVAVGYITPGLLKTTVLEPTHVISSFFFIPDRHPVTAQFWPLLVPGWSINYEMLFYFLFAAAIALSSGKSNLRLAYVVGSILCVVAIGSRIKSHVDIMNFYASPLLFEFILGVLLSVVWRSHLHLRSFYWLGATAAGLFSLWLGAHLFGSFFLVALGAGLVVAGTVFLPPVQPNFLSNLGDASYSLYLTHPLTLAGMGFAVDQLAWRPPLPLLIVFLLAAAIFSACVVYTWVERPMNHALKGILMPKAAA